MKSNTLPARASVGAIALFVFLSASLPTQAFGPAGDLQTQSGPVESLSFIPNQGQYDEAVLFRGDAGGAVIWATEQGVFLHFVRPLTQPSDLPSPPAVAAVDSIAELAIKLSLMGSDEPAFVVGRHPRDYRVHYLIGNNHSDWSINLRPCAAVAYDDVYPGIDWILKGSYDHLEYDFEVAPGADPSLIRLKYWGADSLEVDSDGRLHIYTPFGVIVEEAPVSYQLDGEDLLPRDGGYVLYSGNSFGFVIGPDYNPDLPLVIDPVMTFGTFFGGGGTDQARAVAVGPDSSIVFTGNVNSLDFPLENAFDSTFQDSGTAYYDVFVTRLSPRGDSLRFSTYLGGTGASERSLGIDVDDQGDIYVCGFTASTDFPTVGPFQADLAGSDDGFLVKLSSDGSSLIYGSYLGGAEADAAASVAVDQLGRAFVTGNTGSSDFPTAGTPYDSDLDGTQDAFVCRVSPAGDALEFATYLGGTDSDYGTGVALNEGAYPYVSGYTASHDFPILGGQDSTFGGGASFGDAFITKVDSSGSTLAYSTFLGASSDDFAFGIDVDPEGCAYVTGYTFSGSFPMVNAFNLGLDGLYSGFVSKLNPDGDTLRFSSFIGGSGEDIATSIAVDQNTGAAAVGGITTSLDFHIKNAVQPSPGGQYDAFATLVGAGGDTLIFSTYLGGTQLDFGYGIAVDAHSNVILTGYTDSPGFPLANPYQESLAGGYDAFAVKLSLEGYDCFDTDQDGYGDPDHPENDCPDDNCPTIANSDQADIDSDGVGDVCDNCPDSYNAAQDDYDLDGVGDSCDTCTDSDGDGLGNPGFPYNTCADDNCPEFYNPEQIDSDGDGAGDECDECTDLDDDGFGDPGYPANTCPEDNCPSIANPSQEDSDADGIGDSCDNCFDAANPSQEDYDADGIGDSCDTCTDYDNDGYGNPGFPYSTCDEDNCPYVYNPGQEDADSNGVGDACDAGCCIEPTRGNIDFDQSDEISITDLVYLVTYMFNGGPPPPCPEEADVDGNGSEPDIADLVHLVNFMFNGGESPAACP